MNKKQIKDNMILLVDFKNMRLSEGGTGNISILIGTLRTNFIYDNGKEKYVELHAETVIPTNPKLMIFTKTNNAREVRGYREYIETLSNSFLKMITNIKKEKQMMIGKKIVEKNIKDIIILNN
jgi:hypothetical protein